MKKTGDFVKLKDKSMYFPKVELTYDELYTLYVYGHASPQFLYQVVVDSNMVDKVIRENCKSRPNKKDGYKYLLDKLKKKIDEVQQDLLLFSKGKIDLIDLSVKYGFYYYDLNPEQFDKKTKYLLKQKLCGYDEKVYARKTVVYEAKRDIRIKCVAFLNEYHLQGSATATKYFAMEYCGELVGVASFKQHKGYVELKRLCFKRGVQVLGGLSKFIKAYFKSDTGCDIIKSFSDNNIGNGMSDEKAGAELVGEIKTSLCFISPNNGLDMYSWQIATPWSAISGVLPKYTSQLSAQNEIDEYIETKMPHRFDDGHGYDRVYRVCSKIWQFSRQK